MHLAMKSFIFILPAIFATFILSAADTISVENQYLKRILVIDTTLDKIQTTGFIHKKTAYDFHRKPSPDFSISINGETVDGFSAKIRLDKINSEPENLKLHVNFLNGRDDQPVELILNYQSASMGISKQIEVINRTDSLLLLENICIESLNLDPWGGSNSLIHGNFGRTEYKPPYEGFQNDPALFLEGRRGTILFLNEAPGITRYTDIFSKTSNLVNIGLRPSDNTLATSIRLLPGEKFLSPKAWIFFSPPGENPSTSLKNHVRSVMDLPFLKRDSYPPFFYNTWAPFGTDINETMVKELVDSIEGTGAGYFIIDDGWQNNYGDWDAHPEKFPSGMKSISDYIRSKGMKPGIWFSLCSVEKNSEAFHTHRDNAIKSLEGKPSNIHGWANDLEFLTMDILSPWYDYILEKTRMMIEEFGFEYFKIDLAFVKSAYITNPSVSGNYRDGVEDSRHEFYYPAYQRLMEFFDELKSEYPHVIFDCTYELWGDHHAIDYSLIQHADVDWISNFFDDPPEGSIQVRRLAWSRGNIIPSATMMIGNQQMDAPNHRFSFISGFSGIPMMLGDPRNLTVSEKTWYREMSSWFSHMQRKYNFMPYYQTEGFDYPARFNWDGFTRINPDKGGIICVFRNESPDEIRNILVRSVKESGYYRIINKDGEIIGTFKGSTLSNQGYKVSIDSPYSARVYEIEVLE